MKISQRQIEYVVEVCKIAGLGTASAFTADWVFGAGHVIRDLVGAMLGIAFLVAGFHLTRYLKDDSL